MPNKKPVEDKLWEKGLNATPVAVAIDNLVRPVAISITPLFHDLERTYGMIIRWCHKGIVVELDGDIIYEKGRYEQVGAWGSLECANQRRHAYVFLRWCCTHYPTEKLNQNKAWIYGH